MAIFQIFQARFLDGHFFGLQEGSMKSEILLPPLVAFESLPSVSSLGWCLTLKIITSGAPLARLHNKEPQLKNNKNEKQPS